MQEIWCFTEEFKPQGAESLPDAVNSSTEWNGKLEDAYSELAKVLDCIRTVQDDINVSDCAISLTSVYQTSGDYEEGVPISHIFSQIKRKRQSIQTEKHTAAIHSWSRTLRQYLKKKHMQLFTRN